jgi:hypothetical protein
VEAGNVLEGQGGKNACGAVWRDKGVKITAGETDQK